MPTIIAETKIRFEIWCRECGAGLCGMTEVNGETVEVEPYPDCIREAEYRGETEAIEESKNNYEEGYENGYENGYKKAYEEMCYEIGRAHV